MIYLRDSLIYTWVFVLCLTFYRYSDVNAKVNSDLNVAAAATMNEPVLKNTPHILRYLLHNTVIYIRKIEDTFHLGSRSLDDNIRKSTRSLEDVFSSVATSSVAVDVEPLPREQLTKISLAVNDLRSFVLSTKLQEREFTANIITIKTFVRDFTIDTVNKYVLNRTTVDAVRASCRAALDYVRTHARRLEDRVKTNTRSLEDNIQKFVRIVEDVNEVVAGLPTVNWNEPREKKLSKIKSILSGLVTEYDSSVNIYTQKLQLNITALEDLVETTLRMLADNWTTK